MVQDDKPQSDQLYRLRHSLSHIMAQAVLQIRPKAKLGFGPPIDTGFYYDFDFGNEPLAESDLEEVEKRMHDIIRQKQKFEQFTRPLSEAKKMLKEGEQTYKMEYAEELVTSGQAQDLGFYASGSFVDMCEGPHLKHTGEVPKNCFKLDKIAGSYWRGDEKRPMLTRIYGLAFADAKELKEYRERRELAMQRDHKKLGVQLELFLMDEEVGVGLPLWLPNGTVIRDELEKWAREEEFKAGYRRVTTPIITRSNLYYRSGHLPYYAESMFPPMKVDEHDEYYLRPMNCPHHHKIYASRTRSYRELPLRLAEYGNTYRYEKHGSLSGLLRVRAMCMNDAHIYCETDQVKSEFENVMTMYRMYYQHLRLGNFRVRLSLHDKNKDKFIGDEEQWQNSEKIVREVLHANDIAFEEATGEAAFYGPKVDIQVQNLMGREETVSTCQLDFVMADRFELKYTARDGLLHVPYIIHRAPLSTHERMISFLIEFYGGAFPTWLAPIQVRILPVSEQFYGYAAEIRQRLQQQMFRAEVDEDSSSFNKLVRNAITSKIPNIWIVGKDEMENHTVTWRRYCVKEQPKMSLDRAIDALLTMRQKRTMDNFDDVSIS